MKHRRLLGLLALLGVVIAIRWWDPLKPRTPQPIVAPVADHVASTRTVAQSPDSLRSESSADKTPLIAWPARPALAASDADFAAIHNPFAPRLSAMPPPVAPPVVAVAAKPVAPVPPPPPPEPPPALQVIGTWNDGHGSGVFIAGPDGTTLVHPGDVLQAQYKVVSVDPRQVAVEELGNKRRWELPVPGGTGAPWQAQ